MATLARLDATAGDTGNTATYTSSSFTPTAGLLLWFGCHVTGTALVAATATASANGITFTRINTQISNGGLTFNKYAFIANQFVPASPVAMTCTIDVTADPGTGCGMDVIGVGGMTFTGLAAVRQFNAPDNNNSVAGSTPTNTFSVAPIAGNPLIGFAGNNVTTGASVTPPSGWTEFADIGFSTPSAGTEFCGLAAGSTTALVTWGSTMSVGSTSVFELDASVPAARVPFVSQRQAALRRASLT